MSSKFCIHAVVSGHVQGVFYRASTVQVALDYGLKGWIQNLPNGNVELTACGTHEQIQKLIEWLWQGPPDAEVSDVQFEEVTFQEFQTFRTEKYPYKT